MSTERIPHSLLHKFKAVFGLIKNRKGQISFIEIITFNCNQVHGH